MARRINRNAPDDAVAKAGGEHDATDPAITEAVLAELLAFLTGAITTDVDNTVSVVRPVPTLRYSIAIDPFDTKAMDLTSSYGRG